MIDVSEASDRIIEVRGASRLTISNIILSRGAVSGRGGGIYNTSGALTLTRTRIIQNAATFGGGIFNLNGQVTIIDSVLADNVGSEQGGAVYTAFNSGSALTISRSVLIGNTAPYGAGILAGGGLVSVMNAIITRNAASVSGGGLAVQGATVSVTGSTISDNSGIWGGGIQSGGFLNLTNTTLSGNRATVDGGALQLSGGTTAFRNVTVTGNVADSDGNGVGDGGGIFNFPSNPTFIARNVILAGNTDGSGQAPDCAGPLVSQGYNLILSAAGCTIVGDTTGNIIGVDPLLASLQDNGGRTPTHALLAGSPAIDAANPAGCTDERGNVLTTDQRGYVRPVDGNDDGTSVCDMGAYEYKSTPP
jgi:hypothetical protein